MQECRPTPDLSLRGESRSHQSVATEVAPLGYVGAEASTPVQLSRSGGTSSTLPGRSQCESLTLGLQQAQCGRNPAPTPQSEARGCCRTACSPSPSARAEDFTALPPGRKHRGQLSPWSRVCRAPRVGCAALGAVSGLAGAQRMPSGKGHFPASVHT